MGGRGSSSMSAKVDTSYWLQHRPSDLEAAANHEGAALAYDLLNPDGVFPNDILDHPEWYFAEVIGSLARSEPGARETIATLKSIQGKPDAVLTIYRGAPSDDLNTGDWVTLSRSYAEIYAGDGPYSDNPSSRVNAFKAKASELTFSGDSLYEFGYWGKRQIARR